MGAGCVSVCRSSLRERLDFLVRCDERLGASSHQTLRRTAYCFRNPVDDAFDYSGIFVTERRFTLSTPGDVSRLEAVRKRVFRYGNICDRTGRFHGLVKTGSGTRYRFVTSSVYRQRRDRGDNDRNGTLRQRVPFHEKEERRLQVVAAHRLTRGQRAGRSYLPLFLIETERCAEDLSPAASVTVSVTVTV